MYDDVCMMTFQICHFLSRIVTKISNCVLCNKRRFVRRQNLIRHLIWHAYPVVSKAPNDDDELNFEATHEWLCQFKKNYLWPVQIHRNLEHGMPSPNGSSVDSSDNE